MFREFLLNKQGFSAILITRRRFYFTRCVFLVILLFITIAFPISKALGNTLSQPSPTDITSVAWRADGDLFAAATRSEVWLYTPDGAPVTELMIDTGFEPHFLSWHPSEHKLALAALSRTSDERLYVWSVTGNPPNITIVADEPIQVEFFGLGCLSWSPDTRLAFTYGSDEIVICDTATGDLTQIGPEGNILIDGVAWSPDGARLIASVLDEVRVFETTNYQQVSVLESQNSEDYPGPLVWSPAGNRLAVGEGSTIVIWEYDTSLDSFQPITTLTQSQEYVFWLDWQADRLVATCNDYIIRVWDTTTWEVVNTFPFSTVPKSGFALALSPDGSQVAYADEDDSPAIEPSNPINAYPCFEDFENGTDRWALTGHWAANSSQFHSGTWSVRNLRGTDYTAFLVPTLPRAGNWKLPGMALAAGTEKSLELGDRMLSRRCR